MSTTERKLDWIYLPAEWRAKSLWEILHDATLVSIHSDLLKRTISLEFDVIHVRQHHNLSAEMRLIIELQDVESARATVRAIWPG